MALESRFQNTCCKQLSLSQASHPPTRPSELVAAGLGVTLPPEQTTALRHAGVAFHPLSPPLRRESAAACRADHSSKPLKIVKELGVINPT